jgi:hypothetical protein
MVRQTSSALRVLKNVSTMALSKQFPLPDIEIEMRLCHAETRLPDFGGGDSQLL